MNVNHINILITTKVKCKLMINPQANIIKTKMQTVNTLKTFRWNCPEFTSSNCFARIYRYLRLPGFTSHLIVEIKIQGKHCGCGYHYPESITLSSKLLRAHRWLRRWPKTTTSSAKSTDVNVCFQGGQSCPKVILLFSSVVVSRDGYESFSQKSFNCTTGL